MSIDELALLSSLRFAPLGSQPLRLSRQDSQTSEGEASRLKEHLQNLITAHQSSLFDNFGNVEPLRRDFIHNLQALEHVVRDILDAQRFELIKLMAQREDSSSVVAQIEALTTTTSLETEHGQESDDLFQLEQEILRLRQQLDDLETRRAQLKSNMERKRAQKTKKIRDDIGELKRLRALPSCEELSSAIKSLNLRIKDNEDEVEALSQGADMLHTIVDFLHDSEQEIGLILTKGDDEALASEFDRVIDQLSQWNDTIQEKQWKLLLIVVGSELESFKIAKSMIHHKSKTGKERAD